MSSTWSNRSEQPRITAARSLALGTVAGSLLIESDDADEPRVEVPLLGRPPLGCAELTPGALNLGQVEVGQTSGRARRFFAGRLTLGWRFSSCCFGGVLLVRL